MKEGKGKSQKEGTPPKGDFVPQRLDFNLAEANPRPSKAEAKPKPQKKGKAPSGANAPTGTNVPNATSQNAKAQTASKPYQGRTPSVRPPLTPESQL